MNKLKQYYAAGYNIAELEADPLGQVRTPIYLSVEADEEIRRLREALIAALEWIDAVPSETVLPTMPGFDRDRVDQLLTASLENTP